MGKKSIREDKNIFQLSREEAGLTRAQASEKLVFISESRIEKYESGKSEEILDKLSSKLRFSEPYKIMTEKSLYQRRENQKEKFTPQAVTPEKSQEENMTEFVLEPLYTQKEIRDFRKKNEQNGKFTVTKDTVKSIEDLEKLFMVWQHATESADSKAQIEVAQEMENEAGFRFSKLTIEGVESDG